MTNSNRAERWYCETKYRSATEKLARVYLHSIRDTGNCPGIWETLQEKLSDSVERTALQEEGYQIYA